MGQDSDSRSDSTPATIVRDCWSHLGNPGLAERLGPSMNSARAVLVGMGTPNADTDRSGPSLAMVVEDKAHAVDFGRGVVSRAAAAQPTGVDVAQLWFSAAIHCRLLGVGERAASASRRYGLAPRSPVDHPPERRKKSTNRQWNPAHATAQGRRLKSNARCARASHLSGSHRVWARD